MGMFLWTMTFLAMSLAAKLFSLFVDPPMKYLMQILFVLYFVIFVIVAVLSCCMGGG